MTLHLSNGAPVGTVVDDGSHRPCRALACRLSIFADPDPAGSPLDSAQRRRAHQHEGARTGPAFP